MPASEHVVENVAKFMKRQLLARAIVYFCSTGSTITISKFKDDAVAGNQFIYMYIENKRMSIFPASASMYYFPLIILGWLRYYYVYYIVYILYSVQKLN